MHHSTRSLAGLLTVVVALATASLAVAQPLDVTWTEIPAHYTRGANAQFGGAVPWDGERLALWSLGRLDLYTFDGATATWETQIALDVADTTDGFPGSVAIDHGRLLVTASDAAVGQFVYEWTLGGSTWTQVARVRNPMPPVGDGTLVALGIDGARWAVSAPYITGNRGAVDLVRSPGTGAITWTTGNRSEVLGPTAQEITGHVMELRGADLLVSALRGYVGGISAGRVVLYRDTGSALMTVVTIDNPSPATEDQFGADVALDDTYLYIAAHYDDTMGNDAGAVYVYDRAGSLHQTIYGPRANGAFGGSLEVDGDWMVVGAPTTGAAPGLAYTYVYRRDAGGTWQQRAAIPDASGASGTYLGAGLTLRGNVFVAGAPGANLGGASQAGRAFFAVITEPDGGECAVDAECTHGHCVSGICCNTACGGACDACGTGTCVVMACDAGAGDAGSDAAMSMPDAASVTDAGIDAGVDAAAIGDADVGARDAGAMGDAAHTSDASMTSDAGGVPRIPLSCTCRATTPSSARAPLLLLGLAWLAWQTRRASRR